VRGDDVAPRAPSATSGSVGGCKRCNDSKTVQPMLSGFFGAPQ
jgi:hypothetical protein